MMACKSRRLHRDIASRQVSLAQPALHYSFKPGVQSSAQQLVSKTPIPDYFLDKLSWNNKPRHNAATINSKINTLQYISRKTQATLIPLTEQSVKMTDQDMQISLRRRMVPFHSIQAIAEISRLRYSVQPGAGHKRRPKLYVRFT
jgi:hypothetical protein